MTNTKAPGYKASKEELLKRLARVEGQVRGVTRMVEEDRYCIDVLTQIEAAEAALNKIALGLVDDHVRQLHARRQGRLRGAGAGADGRCRPAGQLVGAWPVSKWARRSPSTVNFQAVRIVP